MRIEKTKSAVKNITFGFLNKILFMIFPFIIKTIIIYKLGVEYLGLNSLFSSVLNILNFAEIGFGTALVFSMYKPLAEDDKETICALLGLYKKIYRIVGLIVVTAGLAVMPFLKFFIKSGLPADINLYALYLVYLFNNVCDYFFFAYKSSLLSIHQRNDVLSNISSIVNIGMYLFQIASLYLFKNYYVYIIFSPISTIVNNIVIGIVTKKMYPEYTCTGDVSAETKSEIKKKVFGLMCHKVGSVVQSSIDNIAISAFFGLAILGVYNNYVYIQSAVQSFVRLIFQCLTPGIGNVIFRDSKEDNYKLYLRLFFMNACLIIFCSSCLLSLYQPFMKIWDKVNNPLSFDIIILIVVLFYVNNIRSTAGMYREALGTWDKDKLRPLFITLFNLVGTIISAYYGWFEGVILSTILSYVIVSMYWEIHVLYKVYFKFSKREYILNFFLYTVIGFVVCIVTYFVTGLIPNAGVKMFALKALVCFAVTMVTLIVLLCWKKEFRYWMNKFKNILSKRKKKDVKQTQENS